MSFRTSFIISVILLVSRSAVGGFITYLGDTGFDQWQSDVGNFNAIDFGGFTTGTVITNQYSDLGINFATCCGTSGGSTFAWVQASEEFSGGGRLTSNNGIRIEFTTPQHAMGTQFFGSVAFAFYLEGEFVDFAPAPIDGFPSWFSTPGLGQFFVGFITEQPFDEVYLFKPVPPLSNNSVNIEDLYWGMPIPAPGALPLLALAFLTGARRRRR